MARARLRHRASAHQPHRSRQISGSSKFIEERPNDRIGLIAFAGAPSLISPLTLDHDWLQQNLANLSVASVADDGTAIGEGIAACVNRLRMTPAKSKVAILLTDGVNNTGKISPLAAAEAARSMGVRIYTIGVGGKAPILLRDDAGTHAHRHGRCRCGRKDAVIDRGRNRGQVLPRDRHRFLAKDLRRDQPARENRPIGAAVRAHRGAVPFRAIPALVILGVGSLIQHTRLRRLPRISAIRGGCRPAPPVPC